MDHQDEDTPQDGPESRDESECKGGDDKTRVFFDDVEGVVDKGFDHKD